MLNILLSIFVACVVTGCSGPRFIDYFPYNDNGIPKPRIALMPVISTQPGLPRHFTEELTKSINYELMDHGKVFALSKNEIGPAWNRKAELDFFGKDLSFAKQFCHTDFVVALELIEHSWYPCEEVSSTCNRSCTPHSINQVLTIKMRVRVIDTRYKNPRIVHYEILKCCKPMSAPYKHIGFRQTNWTSQVLSMAPSTTEYQQLIHDVVKRLEEVTRHD